MTEKKKKEKKAETHICHAAQIELWSKIYAGKAPWLNKNIENAGVFATVAGEIARLVTLELKSEVDGSARAAYIDKLYQSVISKLRIQTEYAFAKGSMIFNWNILYHYRKFYSNVARLFS